MKWQLGLILFVFAFFGIWTANVTPYRTAGILRFQRDAAGNHAQIPDIGAPDERQHANYIAYLLKERKFPVLVPGSADLGEMYQAHQPPLYYILASTLGDPTTPEGAKTRYINVLIGLATLVALFRIGKICTSNESVGFAVAAMGLLPGFLVLHAAISNDPLVICLSAWTVVFLLLGVVNGWTLRIAVAAGVCAGLAMLTKSSAVALAPTTLAAIIVSIRNQNKPDIKVLAALIAVPILIALPWLMRNQSLYGDPLALKAFTEAFSGSPKAEMFIQAFGAPTYWTDYVAWWTYRSFIAAYGYMDIFLDSNTYRIFGAVIVVFLLGHILKSRTSPDDRATPGAPAILWTLFTIVVLQFLMFNRTYFQGQARYLMPAAPAIFFAFGLGLVYLFKSKKELAFLVPLALFGGLQFWLLSSYLPQQFAMRILP